MKRSQRAIQRRKAALARNAERIRLRKERASAARRGQTASPTTPLPQFEKPLSPLHFKVLPRPGDRIWLFTHYFAIDPAHQQKVDDCIANNLADSHFEGVVVLAKESEGRRIEGDPARLHMHWVQNPPTFVDFFDAMKAVCQPGDVVVLANPYLWFDESLSLLYKLDLDQRVLALSVHQATQEIPPQDAWVFSWPLQTQPSKKIIVGGPRNDRRIALEFQKAGYKVSNPSRLLHIHGLPEFRHSRRRSNLPFLSPTAGEELEYKKRTRGAGTHISSISTLVTEPLADELWVLVKSLELAGIDLPLYVLTDTATAEMIPSHFPERDIRVTVGLDAYTGKTREQMVKMRIWDEFMLEKTNVISTALNAFPNTLFVDCDLVFLNPISAVNLGPQAVALSPHHIIQRDEARFGRYNAGYVAVQDPAFLAWWRKATYTLSKYHEQECLTHAHKHFNVGEIPIQHNFGWWRLDQSGERSTRLARFTAGAGGIFYEGQPLVSVHTHILSREPRFEPFNQLVLDLLFKSQLDRHRELGAWIQRKRDAGL